MTGEDSTEAVTEQYAEVTTESASAEIADPANDTREALAHDGSQHSSVSFQKCNY